MKLVAQQKQRCCRWCWFVIVVDCVVGRCWGCLRRIEWIPTLAPVAVGEPWKKVGLSFLSCCVCWWCAQTKHTSVLMFIFSLCWLKCYLQCTSGLCGRSLVQSSLVSLYILFKIFFQSLFSFFLIINMKHKSQFYTVWCHDVCSAFFVFSYSLNHCLTVLFAH